MIKRPSLDSIVKLAKLKQESTETIVSLWQRLHSEKKGTIVATLKKQQYHKLMERASQAPMFVFPVYRGEGYVSYLFQAQHEHGTFLYTDLEQYKQKGAQATPALTCCYYPELLESKGIALMHGKVATDQLKTSEAQYLGASTSMFMFDDKNFKLMHDFNHAPNSFDFKSVLDILGGLKT